jgi:hypothetical protein
VQKYPDRLPGLAQNRIQCVPRAFSRDKISGREENYLIILHRDSFTFRYAFLGTKNSTGECVTVTETAAEEITFFTETKYVFKILTGLAKEDCFLLIYIYIAWQKSTKLHGVTDHKKDVFARVL